MCTYILRIQSMCPKLNNFINSWLKLLVYQLIQIHFISYNDPVSITRVSRHPIKIPVELYLLLILAYVKLQKPKLNWYNHQNLSLLIHCIALSHPEH